MAAAAAACRGGGYCTEHLTMPRRVCTACSIAAHDATSSAESSASGPTEPCAPPPPVPTEEDDPPAAEYPGQPGSPSPSSTIRCTGDSLSAAAAAAAVAPAPLLLSLECAALALDGAVAAAIAADEPGNELPAQPFSLSDREASRPSYRALLPVALAEPAVPALSPLPKRKPRRRAGSSLAGSSDVAASPLAGGCRCCSHRRPAEGAAFTRAPATTRPPPVSPPAGPPCLEAAAFTPDCACMMVMRAACSRAAVMRPFRSKLWQKRTDVRCAADAAAAETLLAAPVPLVPPCRYFL